MPLPPALAARLAKRGLVKDVPVQQEKKIAQNEEEEVFAEDYDDVTKPEDEARDQTPAVTSTHTRTQEQVSTPKVHYAPNETIMEEVINCPIKVNPYHECSDYCKKTYGLKPFEPDIKMIKLRDRMLRKYPLPENWREVADPYSNRYYYWNMMSDQVSWLSPGHPKAIITLPAERLKGLLSEDKEELSDDEDEKMEGGSDLSDDDSMSDTDSEEEMTTSEPRGKKRSRDYGRDSDRGRNRRGRKVRDELDPMDPASYSEAPRGTWSSGLDQRGSAKTGVDATASGPLFQQRPYPSPGAVLRANKQMQNDS